MLVSTVQCGDNPAKKERSSPKHNLLLPTDLRSQDPGENLLTVDVTLNDTDDLTD